MNWLQRALLLAAAPVFVGFALGRLSGWAIVAAIVGVIFVLARGPRRPVRDFLQKWLPHILGYCVGVWLLIWLILWVRDNMGEGPRTLPSWWG
jgi:hypothetical protein